MDASISLWGRYALHNNDFLLSGFAEKRKELAWGARKKEAELIEKVAENNEKLARHDIEIELIKQRIETKENTIKSISSKVELVDAHLTALQTKHDVSNAEKFARLEAIENSNRTLVAQNERLASEMRALSASMSTLSNSLSNLAGKIEGKEKQKATAMAWLLAFIPHAIKFIVWAGLLYFLSVTSNLQVKLPTNNK